MFQSRVHQRAWGGGGETCKGGQSHKKERKQAGERERKTMIEREIKARGNEWK